MVRPHLVSRFRGSDARCEHARRPGTARHRFASITEQLERVGATYFTDAFDTLLADSGAAPRPAVQATDYAGAATDHEGLAVQYENQAETHAAAARRHEGYAAVYRCNTSLNSGRQEHVALAEHCEKLARTYKQAAYENASLARLHRRLAAEAAMLSIPRSHSPDASGLQRTADAVSPPEWCASATRSR